MDTSQAIKRAGSINQLAAIMGVTRQVVQGWKKRGLPEYRARELKQKRPEWFVPQKG